MSDKSSKPDGAQHGHTSSEPAVRQRHVIQPHSVIHQQKSANNRK